MKGGGSVLAVCHAGWPRRAHKGPSVRDSSLMTKTLFMCGWGDTFCT